MNTINRRGEEEQDDDDGGPSRGPANAPDWRAASSRATNRAPESWAGSASLPQEWLEPPPAPPHHVQSRPALRGVRRREGRRLGAATLPLHPHPTLLLLLLPLRFLSPSSSSLCSLSLLTRLLLLLRLPCSALVLYSCRSFSCSILPLCISLLPLPSVLKCDALHAVGEAKKIIDFLAGWRRVVRTHGSNVHPFPFSADKEVRWGQRLTMSLSISLAIALSISRE